MSKAVYEQKVLCSFCGEGLVSVARWNMRCSTCKSNNNTKTYNAVTVSKRDPSAIIHTDEGEKVFVDKFGREVDNPGYDLENDRHGKHFTHGRARWEGKTIL